MPAIAIPAGKLLIDGIIAGLAIAGGILLLSVVAKEIAEYIDRELSDAIDRARDCRNCGCGDCEPPRGTVGVRVDWVPPSVPHAPCTGSHVHFYLRSQNPNDCRCFWSAQRRKVLCLDDGVGPGDFDPSDLGPNVFVMP